MTAVPAASGPAAGVTLDTAGIASYVKRSLTDTDDPPPGVATVTSTAPGRFGGVVAVIVVALTTVNDVAATVPNFTPVVRARSEPEIVTPVPPATGPTFGETDATPGTFA